MISQNILVLNLNIFTSLAINNVTFCAYNVQTEQSYSSNGP